MIKLLHLADLHFDTVLKSRREETRRHLRDALRTALENAVSCAVREEVDAVLIAGDLFDNENLGYSTERFILSQMKTLGDAGIPVVYATGNHDPGGGASRASRIEWPSNCVFIDQPTPIVTELTSRRTGRAFNVVAAGFSSREVDDNIAASFPEASGSDPYIGILHTLVTDSPRAGGHSRYAPCLSEDLRNTGYAYWALGHIHVRHQVKNNVPAWYAGNIQGSTPREAGPRGGLLVTIDGSNRADVTFRQFSPVIWETIDVSLMEHVEHMDQLARELERVATDKLSHHPVNSTMLRFRLQGQAPICSELNNSSVVKELEETMRDVLDALDVEVSAVALSVPAETGKYRSEPHVLGRALNMVDEVVASPRDSVTALLGDNAVIDWSNASDEMIDELLVGLGEEIADRMLRS